MFAVKVRKSSHFPLAFLAGGWYNKPTTAALTPKTGFEAEGRPEQELSRGLPGLFAAPFSGRGVFLFQLCRREFSPVETRIAVIGIVVESEDSVEPLNEILHEYREYIIGRMGIPYRQKGLNIISIAVDAPQDAISALSGKVGKLPGVSSKTAYAGVKK